MTLRPSFPSTSPSSHPRLHHCRIQILRLPAADTEILYRRHFATTEFFPRDIDVVLSNQLSLGTYLAVEQEFRWEGIKAFLEVPPESWVVVSVWNSKEVFRLEVRGASRWWRGLAQTTWAVDRALPWLSHTSLGRFVALPWLVSVPFARQSSMIFSAASPLVAALLDKLGHLGLGKPHPDPAASWDFRIKGGVCRRGWGPRGASEGWLVVTDGSGDGILIVAGGFGEVILSAGGGGAAVGFEEEADGGSGSWGGADEDDSGGRGRAMEEGGGVGGKGRGGEAPPEREEKRPKDEIDLGRTGSPDLGVCH